MSKIDLLETNTLQNNYSFYIYMHIYAYIYIFFFLYILGIVICIYIYIYIKIPQFISLFCSCMPSVNKFRMMRFLCVMVTTHWQRECKQHDAYYYGAPSVLTYFIWSTPHGKPLSRAQDRCYNVNPKLRLLKSIGLLNYLYTSFNNLQ